MMIRLGTAPRTAGLNFEDFQEHWGTSHADVVSHLPGLRRYQQFHAVLEDGEPLLDYPDFDACSVLHFDSVDSMEAAFQSEEFLTLVKDDEEKFVNKELFRGLVGTWRPDLESQDFSVQAIQVMSFFQAQTGETPQQLAEQLANPESVNASSAGSLVDDRSMHGDDFPVIADVVRIVHYPDKESALAGAREVRLAAGSAALVGEHIAFTKEVRLA